MFATKLFRPSRRERLVARWRLIEELDRSLAEHHRLTLVSAPAGFGKTTLLGDWLDSLAQRRTDVDIAWLSLDGADNDPARLLRHLVAALRRCGVEVDPGPDSSDVAAALADLVNELTAVGERRLLLVLDDYHVIDDAAVHEAIGFLLDNLPRGLHLVLATRSDPPLPLTRLRVRDQLVELRAADLRFTPREARDFLNQVMGLDLTTRDVEALEARTEGWAAGLQLAALSLQATRTRDETDRFIADFAGSNRFVIDYLVDEVLARVPPETHRFLLHTSVLDRLTGPLCDAVMGGAGGVDGADGAGTLARLDRDNPVRGGARRGALLVPLPPPLRRRPPRQAPGRTA